MPTFATNVEAVCVKLTSLHATSSERKTASVYPPLIWHVAQITERTRETLDLFFGSRISHRRRQTFQSNTRGAGRVPAEPKQLQKHTKTRFHLQTPRTSSSEFQVADMPQKLRIPIFVYVLLDCFRLRGHADNPYLPRSRGQSRTPADISRTSSFPLGRSLRFYAAVLLLQLRHITH